MLAAFLTIAHMLSCYFFYAGTLVDLYRTCLPGHPDEAEQPCLCNTSVPLAEDTKCRAATWLTTFSFMSTNVGPRTVYESDSMMTQYGITLYWAPRPFNLRSGYMRRAQDYNNANNAAYATAINNDTAIIMLTMILLTNAPFNLRGGYMRRAQDSYAPT